MYYLPTCIVLSCPVRVVRTYVTLTFNQKVKNELMRVTIKLHYYLHTHTHGPGHNLWADVMCASKLLSFDICGAYAGQTKGMQCHPYFQYVYISYVPT